MPCSGGRASRSAARRGGVVSLPQQNQPHQPHHNRVVERVHNSSRMDYGATAIVSGIACVLYWNTLDAQFAYDDSRAIKTNQDLLPTTPITSLFKNDFWGTPLTHSGSHKSYRPLCVLTFRLNYFLGGFDPWGYHFTNVFLHVLVCAIFTKLAWTLFLRSIIPTLVAGILFAAHPIHTEAVAGIVGRADVGACLFFLLCINFYIKYCEYRICPDVCSRRWIYLFASLICAACSMLTKEHGITVLAVCAVYEVVIYHKLAFRDMLRMLFKKEFYNAREGFLSVTIASIILLALRIHLMGSKPPDFAPADNPAADSDSFLTRTLTFFYLPAFNFWLLLYPKWLSFDWSMESIPLLTTLKDLRNLSSLAFYGSLLIFTIWILKGYNRRCICGAYYNIESNHSHPPVHSQRKHALYGIYCTNGEMVTPVCPCLGISQRLALSFTPNNNHHKTRNRASNGHNSANTNGHRIQNGNMNCHTSIQIYQNGASTSQYPNRSNEHYRFHAYIPSAKAAFTGSVDVVIFALALIILPFIPATNLFFYVGFVVAERVLYIPSMGFCLLVALGVDNLYRRQSRNYRKRLVLILTLIAILVMSLRTVIRNKDWYDEENLYRSGVLINPPKAYGNLANILSGRGEKEEAEWAYKKALSHRSNMADVRYNLGILLQEQGRYEEALYSYRLAIQFRPRLAMAHLNMGLVLGILGRKDEAALVYRHCAQLDGTGLKDPKMHESTRISALFNLGRLYADDGKYEEAIRIYKEAVEQRPDHYQPQSLYNMMGEAYFKLNKFPEAERWYKKALEVKPDHIPAHLTYAKLLSKWERYQESEQWFLKAKILAPDDSSVYQHYGQFLSETERHDEAADSFAKAVELAPDDYEIVFNAANALRQAGRNIQAEEFYQQSVKLRPSEATSHMNLGAMLHVNGKLVEAESSYLEALRLRPDDPITQNNLDKLRNLLNKKNAANQL